MSTVRVKWLEKLQFVGIDSTKHSVVISSPDEENGIGMKPSELLLISLGSCTAYDVVSILSKKKKRITGLDVQITSTSRPNYPRTLTHIHLAYTIRGHGLTEKAVRDAIELSKNKYCSVGLTLAAAAEISYEFTIEEEK